MDDTYGPDRFLPIAAWSDGTQENISEFTEARGLTFPNIGADLHARWERDGGIPSFALIAPGHELLMVDEGHPNATQIEDALATYFD
jgi:hypothetical protein